MSRIICNFAKGKDSNVDLFLLFNKTFLFVWFQVHPTDMQLFIIHIY